MINEEIQSVKRQFQIIGTCPKLDRAIEIALQVAPTDMTVLIMGESGTGKEVFPQIIHKNSARKHGPYFSLNCGAIPEGTIDSELFGHVKGAFTGADKDREGYFETADGGTLFLDEIGEMPISTQARLLRVLENGEFIKVGSSKVQKTNVRVVAATNVKLDEAVSAGKFREDLYYRLNTVPINIPPLRERPDDIELLFRKFASDCAAQYRMPVISLTEGAAGMLRRYRWSGNVRQLKNITEQISILEKNREINEDILKNYLPMTSTSLPTLYRNENDEPMTEREILHTLMFDMRKDLVELKKTVAELLEGRDATTPIKHIEVQQLPHEKQNRPYDMEAEVVQAESSDQVESAEENLSMEDASIDLIIKALKKYNGNRKEAADELGISPRTIYRKIKKFGIGL